MNEKKYQVCRFSDLNIGDRFLWSSETAHRHFSGPYQKLAENKCIPEKGGYAAYDLFPAGMAAHVIILLDKKITKGKL